jgi:hypothetical protein
MQWQAAEMTAELLAPIVNFPGSRIKASKRGLSATAIDDTRAISIARVEYCNVSEELSMSYGYSGL